MFSYYYSLALRSLLRNKVLTTLMIVAIALGIGASMTSMTVLHQLSGDPMPGKSHEIRRVQLDAEAMAGFQPGGEPDKRLTRFDATALLRAARADRQAMMTAGSAAVQSTRAGLSPFHVDARYTSSDFFAMFDVPLSEGSAWGATEDEAHARVAVIGAELGAKLFGESSPIGETIGLDAHDFRIVGVVDHWTPSPHFYDLSTGRYGDAEQVFVPFSTALELDLSTSGSTNCWGSSTGSDNHALDAPCAWVQYWVQLDSEAKLAEYRDYLLAYSDQQLAAGRFERPSNIRLRSVMQWLEFNKVVPSDVRLQAWLAFGFLLVCLVNAVGLMLAKFLRRAPEIGVRRALGASRRSIFAQLLIESSAIGVVGGLGGLGMVKLGLWAIRQQPADYASRAVLDWSMFATTLGLALIASVLAGALPAWRACQVPPALQVKSQ